MGWWLRGSSYGRGLVEGSAMWKEASHFPNYIEFSIKSTYKNAELAFSTIPTSQYDKICTELVGRSLGALLARNSQL